MQLHCLKKKKKKHIKSPRKNCVNHVISKNYYTFALRNYNKIVDYDLLTTTSIHI